MQAVQESEITTEEMPLLLGIVGCSLARPRFGAAVALSPQVSVVAMADSDTRFAKAWSRTLTRDIALFPDLQSLLDHDSVPQALLIEVPLGERAEALLAAIPHCSGILCPPPFAATLEQTDRILHAAEANNTLLMPAFPRRFDPVLSYANEIANSGEIGLLQQLRCDWSFPLSRAYGAEIGADPDAGSWDSLLLYTGCQAADVCRWCLGDVLTVSADIDSHTPPETQSGRRDTSPLLANFVLGMEQGPATCHFTRSRAVQPAERYTFTGSLGNLEVVVSSTTNPAAAFPILTVHRQGIRPQPLASPEFEGSELPSQVYRMRAMLTSFAERVRSSPGFSAREDDSRPALEVVHAAYLSAHECRKITLPLRHSPILPL